MIPKWKPQKRKWSNHRWPSARHGYARYLSRARIRKPGAQTHHDGGTQGRAPFSATKRPRKAALMPKPRCVDMTSFDAKCEFKNANITSAFSFSSSFFSDYSKGSQPSPNSLGCQKCVLKSTTQSFSIATPSFSSNSCMSLGVAK